MSARGLHLTVVEGGRPVTLTAFLPTADGRPILSSIRISLVALSDGLASGSRLVGYASAPGAFVDLAADLEFALRSPPNTDGDGQPSAGPEDDGQHEVDDRDQAVVLDADLPPPTLRSGITGLQELSTINQAIGVLIDQGHTLPDAQTALHHQAHTAGVERHRYAEQLLGRKPH